MPRFGSILSRIVVLHVTAVVVTSIAMSAALSWLLIVATDRLHDEAMRGHAIALAASLNLSDNGFTLALPPELQGLYAQPYGRYSYAVLDEAGHVLLSSRPDHSAIFPKTVDPDQGIFRQVQRGDATISGVSMLTVVANQKLTVQAAEDLSNRDVLTDDITRGFFQDVGWITIPILLTLLLIDLAIISRALRPLREASAIAQQIGPTRTDLRLPLHNVPQELLPLMSAVNLALDRLEDGFRLQREFTADAAHELRTPLSVLRARTDLISDKVIAASLRSDIEGMSHIISQLLTVAEIEAMVLDPFEVADLHAVCAEVASFFAPVAISQGKAIALLGYDETLFVRGNAEMLALATRNLTDNALKHAPAGTTVDIIVERTGFLRVRDRGLGVKNEEVGLIFQRFWRRDRNSSGSSGLGLSIVKRVAELHSAEVEVITASGGGAQFSIALELA